MEIFVSLVLTALVLFLVVAASPGPTRHEHGLTVSEIKTRIAAELGRGGTETRQFPRGARKKQTVFASADARHYENETLACPRAVARR